jgi:ADP-ribosyl-[dinitrogen reductase] hydrolase
VGTAVQAAWAVIAQTPVPDDWPEQHLRVCLEEAVRIGNDTDTVAAIAGQLLGACWGASAIPAEWRQHLHGWPGLREPDLVRLAVTSVRSASRRC